jgi:hypothetical protein
MAKEPETLPKPSLSDTNARDSFIAAALREIVAWQLAESKMNHDQAGALAVRYGNAVMAARGSETASLKVMVAKGTKTEKIELSSPLPRPELPTDDTANQPPKRISEIIGDAEPLAEVK